MRYGLVLQITPSFPALCTLAHWGGESSTPRPLGSITAVSGMLDRPVKPGDDSECCRRTIAFSRRISPELCFVVPPSKPRGRREGRVLTSHPRSAARKAHAGRTAQQHTGGANHSAFPAQWSDGLCRALPGAEFPLASLTLAKVTSTAPVDATAAFAKHLTVATTARTTRLYFGVR